MPVLVLSLVDNATLAGKRSMLYISGYTGLSYTLAVWFSDVSQVEVYKYIHTYVQHVGRDRRLPRSIPKYRIACASVKKIDKQGGRRGRKINETE